MRCVPCESTRLAQRNSRTRGTGGTPSRAHWRATSGLPPAQTDPHRRRLGYPTARAHTHRDNHECAVLLRVTRSVHHCAVRTQPRSSACEPMDLLRHLFHPQPLCNRASHCNSLITGSHAPSGTGSPARAATVGKTLTRSNMAGQRWPHVAGSHGTWIMSGTCTTRSKFDFFSHSPCSLHAHGVAHYHHHPRDPSLSCAQAVHVVTRRMSAPHDKRWETVVEPSGVAHAPRPQQTRRTTHPMW